MADDRTTETATTPKDTKSLTEWWITTDFFSRGGTKVRGPFTRRNKALVERTALERKSGFMTYAIDSTKRKVKIKNSQYQIGYKQGFADAKAEYQVTDMRSERSKPASGSSEGVAGRHVTDPNKRIALFKNAPNREATPDE